MTVRAHKNAVLNRVREDEVLSSTYDGDAENEDGSPVTVPYAVVYSDQGIWSGERIDFSQIRGDFTYTIHSVGSTVDQAQLVSEHVASKLRNWVPTVPDRTCWPMRSVASQPATADRDGAEKLFVAIDVYELTSTPK